MPCLARLRRALVAALVLRRKFHIEHLLGLVLACIGLSGFVILSNYSLGRWVPLSRVAEGNAAHSAEQPGANTAITTGSSSLLRLNEPEPATTARISEAYGKLPLSFEANEGQTDPQVKFLARGSGYSLFLTPTEAVLTLRTADCGLRNEEAAAREADDPHFTTHNLKSNIHNRRCCA